MRRSLALLATLPLVMLACSTGETEVEGGSAPAGSGSPVVVATIPPDPARDAIDDPHVVIDGGGGVHLIWWDNAVIEGRVAHAVVDESAVGEPEDISDAMAVFTAETSVLVSPAGEVCAFFDGWLDEQDLSTRGYYVRCLSGATWTPPERVTSQGTTSTFDPAFEADGAPLAVATTPISSITFEGLELSEDDDGTLQAQLEIDGSGAYHVVWEELGTTANEIDHRFSTDGGSTWSPIEAFGVTVLGEPPALIAGADGSVHMLYQDTAGVIDRAWTSAGGWGAPTTGSQCGGLVAFALGPGDRPVAACASIDGVQLSILSGGVWSGLETVETSSDVPATEIALAVGADGARHVAWVTATDPVELRYAVVPAPA